MRAPRSPQVRFLLRASSLLIAMLALWWLVLLHPMLDGLRMTTSVVLRVLGSSDGATVASNGDWVLQVPIPESIAKQDAVQRTFGRAPGAPLVKVRSFKLAIAERIPIFFLLSFPLFWALTLAAPWVAQSWRAAAIGTGILALLAELSLLFYAAFSIETNLHLLASDLANILWSAAEYLNVNVIPYMAPLILAMWLHSALRAQIFSMAPAVAEAPKVVPVSKKRR